MKTKRKAAVAAAVRLLVVAGCLVLGAVTGFAADEPVDLRSVLGANDEVVSASQLNFDVTCTRPEAGWVPEIIARADSARRLVNEATRDALLVRIRILLAPTRAAFLKLTGPGAENSFAVSLNHRQTIIINGEELRRSGAQQLGGLLVHELTHVYLDVRCKGPVPRWLHEGIAREVAREWTGEDSGGVLLARMLHGLIPLKKLENTFPGDADRQQLAYRQSQSVVQYLIKYRHEGSLPSLLQSISGDEGSKQLQMYWTPEFTSVLQAEWQRNLGGWREWIALVFGSSVFWGIVALLSVLAWWIRRRRSRTLHREWAEEERIYEVLDEEERKIYGDEDPDHDPYAVPGEYVDPEYEDVYENGEYRGTRRLND